MNDELRAMINYYGGIKRYHHFFTALDCAALEDPMPAVFEGFDDPHAPKQLVFALTPECVVRALNAPCAGRGHIVDRWEAWADDGCLPPARDAAAPNSVLQTPFPYCLLLAHGSWTRISMDERLRCQSSSILLPCHRRPLQGRQCLRGRP